MKAAADGLLLLGPALEVMYANAEAAEILAYPQNPGKIQSMNSFLEKRIRSVLLRKPSSPQAGFVRQVTSGNRIYLCRAFSLTSQANGTAQSPAVAILIERGGKVSLDTAKLAEHFRLTPRERETVDYLMQGLTSKEIATRMKISPNTVKAFLRLIMVKMGTSTRSGIIGKIFEAVQ